MRFVDPKTMKFAIQTSGETGTMTGALVAYPNEHGVASEVSNSCEEITKNQYKMLYSLHGPQEYMTYNCGIKHSLVRTGELRPAVEVAVSQKYFDSTFQNWTRIHIQNSVFEIRVENSQKFERKLNFDPKIH